MLALASGISGASSSEAGGGGGNFVRENRTLVHLGQKLEENNILGWNAGLPGLIGLLNSRLLIFRHGQLGKRGIWFLVGLALLINNDFVSFSLSAFMALVIGNYQRVNRLGQVLGKF
jgi:hypothetical protein